MFSGKYGKALTVLLIIAIIAIIGLIAFWIVDSINEDKLKKDQVAGIEEFNKEHGISSDQTSSKTEDDEENNNGEINYEEIPSIVETETPDTSTSNSNTSGSSNKKTTYKGFGMLGHIKIPKNNVEIPIVEVVTKKSLEVAVAVLYPMNAELNQPGNVVIAGHNYKNGTFFSNNKKLQEGDKIYITGSSGTMTYVVYKNFETTPEDTSFYTRDTGGVPEITLTTCTNDSSKRTIILARAE